MRRTVRHIGKVAGLLVVVTLIGLAWMKIPHVRAQSPQPTIVYVRISPGGKTWHTAGGAGASLTFSYFPATVTIHPGTTVVWENKTILPEPHTVTFVKVNPRTGDLDGPPFEIVRPKAGREGSKDPADLEFLENPLYVLPSSLTHAPFYNSGTLFPKGTVPGTDWKWQMTFGAKDVGKTFDYTCAYHPWMTGRIVVAAK